MKVLIIIPAYNEEEVIEKCLLSLYNQTYKDFKVLVVDDNSSDETPKILQKFIVSKSNFDTIHHQSKIQDHIPGTKIIQAFYFGLNKQNIEDYEVICKFDSDLIFPENYIEKMVQEFQSEPKAGMVAGHIYIPKGDSWVYENVANKKHIRGALKAYRKECFLAIQGPRATIGWDNIDELIAQMHGWKIHVLPELKVNQMRPTAFKYKATKGKKLGQFFYHLGLDLPLTLVSALKSGWKNKSIKLVLDSLQSYLHCLWNKTPRQISKEERDYILKVRWQMFWDKLKGKK